jgi:hypothetical protein
MDRDSVRGVGPGTRALGGSGARMSDAGAVLLIFVIVAVALTAKRRRRKICDQFWVRSSAPNTLLLFSCDLHHSGRHPPQGMPLNLGVANCRPPFFTHSHSVMTPS